MAGMNVNLTDVTTNTTYQVELPRDVPMSRLIPALLTRLDLPITGPDGRAMSYRLRTDDGNILQDNDSLSSVGLQDGTNITLTTEMEAGITNSINPMILGKEEG